MVLGQFGMILITVLFLYLAVTVVLPPLLYVLVNLFLIYLLGKQALSRWQKKTHSWYEMGILFAVMILVFYPSLLPFWLITNFIVLSVGIAEFLQWVEKKTL